MQNRITILLGILIASMIGYGAWAASTVEPMGALKEPVDQVISLLKDPQFKAEDKKILQQEKIMAVVARIFDFTEVSKRTVGPNWKEFTPQQRKDFADTFGDFLGFTYYKKVRDAYQGETVVYLSQEMEGNDKAVVKTKIPRPAGDIPLEYRMFRQKDTWRVYDVLIEGVSLVKNYRTQFSEILSKETPDQLIAKLKEKSAQQRSNPEKAQ